MPSFRSHRGVSLLGAALLCVLLFPAAAQAGSRAPVNGVCGPVDGTTVSTKPRKQLCSAGTPSAVSGTGPWTWNCVGTSGGTTASCSAQKTASSAINGVCGTLTGSCLAGTASSVSLSNGTYVWSCAGSNGGVTIQCYAQAAVDGQCGATAGTCLSGTAGGLTVVNGTSTWSCAGSGGGTTASCSYAGSGSGAAATYDQLILADKPVAYWAMNASGATEMDLTGNSNAGTYKGGTPVTATLPNGEAVADFNGSSQYMTVQSNASLSIPTTGNLTWEAWIRPDTLQFTNDSGSGYVDWMGKCADYSPTCEWESRMYSTSNAENRPNRMSAYVFNPSAGLGAAADWQPVNSLIVAKHWYHVVGEYTTLTTPSACSSAYPGSINIWVDGVLWSASSHYPTGCMSQYSIKPKAGTSPLNIGTMAFDTWFPGAVGKVAIYNYLLTQTQITNHYQAMTGLAPGGSCGNTCTLSNP